MRRVHVAVALSLVVSLASSLPAGAQHTRSVVGTDPQGDWGPGPSDLGDMLGQDLIGAAIRILDGSTLEFTLTVSSLPPFDVTSSAHSAYAWDLAVDGHRFRLSNFLCDPLALDAGSCLPSPTIGNDPLDPQLDRIRFELQDCAGASALLMFAGCDHIATLLAIADPSHGTIAIPVPMDLIGARPGSAVTPAADVPWGAVAGMFPGEDAPHDELVISTPFVLPRNF